MRKHTVYRETNGNFILENIECRYIPTILIMKEKWTSYWNIRCLFSWNFKNVFDNWKQKGYYMSNAVFNIYYMHIYICLW